MNDLPRDDKMARAIVEQALSVEICEPFAGLVALDDGRVCGAFILNNYDGRDCHLTGVIFRPLKASHIRQLARCGFVNMGCHRATAVTRDDNAAAIRALQKFGFRSEGRLREHFDGADGLVFGLLRSEQKIIKV